MKNPDTQKRGRLLPIGCLLFVAGITLASYCGYHERYGDGIVSAWLKLAGWVMLLLGVVLFLLGLFQSPIGRR